MLFHKCLLTRKTSYTNPPIPQLFQIIGSLLYTQDTDCCSLITKQKNNTDLYKIWKIIWNNKAKIPRLFCNTRLSRLHVLFQSRVSQLWTRRGLRCWRAGSRLAQVTMITTRNTLSRNMATTATTNTVTIVYSTCILGVGCLYIFWWIVFNLAHM